MLILVFDACNASDCTNPPKIITINQSGEGNFKTIQSGIDSIPSKNSQWIQIKIPPGIYRENITIPKDKPCIYLEGSDMNSTSIEWHDEPRERTYPVLDSEADNVVVKGITFQNTYNHPVLVEAKENVIPAVAASISGDKSAFFECAFLGVQDTLFDYGGRHYFHNCFIQGAVDFIFGNGQSIYENCHIHYTVGKSGWDHGGGYITAHSRETPDDTSGFVFNNCTITGTRSKVNLGRPWRGYARVIFANSNMEDVITPHGWYASSYAGQEDNFTFVEEGNTGPGANRSQRVPWLKHMSESELNQFLNFSYIDQEGWIAKLPARAN
ncbi:Pectinesterase [Quillaja saponaria]|uniref:Pectinesterase n=1 Tax=Quillaja saponaria TaxID=32244 RepID=A0AAD7Q9Z6_QUISA|nr:Pectinesterase [Quillaja saponaria]